MITWRKRSCGLSLSALPARPGALALRMPALQAASWLRLSPLHALLLGLFATLASINNYSVWAVTMAGQVVVGLVMFYAAYLLLSCWLAGGRWPRALLSAAAWSAAFIGFYCIGFFVQGSFRGFRYSVLSAILYLMLFLMLALVRYTNNFLLALGWCFGLFNGLLGVWWLALGLPAEFTAHMTNPNLSGGFFGFSLFFILLALQARQHQLLRLALAGLAVLTLLLSFTSASRAIMLALAGLAIVYYSWRWLTARRWRFYTAFWVLVGVIIVITITIPILQMLPFYEQATALSEELFHKNLQSGRNVIWTLVFQGILDAPLFGHGPYYLPRNLFAIDLSAHNLYLQVALQVGLLGVSALLAMLYAVWRVFWQGRHDNRVRLAAGFTAAILIHQTFDVSLTQHNLSLGLLMWMIMGLGAGLAINSSPPATQPATPAPGGGA
jgi:O-antigen ligase